MDFGLLLLLFKALGSAGALSLLFVGLLRLLWR